MPPKSPPLSAYSSASPGAGRPKCPCAARAQKKKQSRASLSPGHTPSACVPATTTPLLRPRPHCPVPHAQSTPALHAPKERPHVRVCQSPEGSMALILCRDDEPPPPCEMELRDNTPAPQSIAAGRGGGNTQSSGGLSRRLAVGCSGGHRDAGQDIVKVPVCCAGEDIREVPSRTALTVRAMQGPFRRGMRVPEKGRMAGRRLHVWRGSDMLYCAAALCSCDMFAAVIW